VTSDETPTFPPLLRGEECVPGLDPFTKAVASAALGTDPGLICWSRDPARFHAALVLAPEAPLERAVGITFAIALGLGDALGALAPPEVAVHYVGPGGIKVNGADCGQLRAAAATNDPRAEPDWLVVGVEIPYLPEPGNAPGAHPDRTCLSEEGCIEVTPLRLLESWSRHSLVWINPVPGSVWFHCRHASICRCSQASSTATCQSLEPRKGVMCSCGSSMSSTR
jgi:hypothetical protein